MKTSAHLSVLLLATGLLTACSDDSSPTAAPSPDRTPSASPSPSPSSLPSPSADTGAVTLDASCVLQPEDPQLPQVELHHPAGWAIQDPDTDSCRFFDPQDVDIQPQTEATGVAIRVTVDPVEYERAIAPGPELEEADRRETQVDGHRAVRVQGTTTGEGLGPEGRQRTVWLVEVAQGNGVLVLGSDSEDQQVLDVLDAMAEAATIGD